MTSRIHRRWNVLLTPDLRTATIHYIVNEKFFLGWPRFRPSFWIPLANAIATFAVCFVPNEATPARSRARVSPQRGQM